MTSAPPQPLSVTWLGHATVLLELDGTRVLTDPVLGRRAGPLVRIAPPPPPDAASRVDAVLLSHLHADHADLPSLRGLSGSAPILAPAGAAPWLRAKGLRRVAELPEGQGTEVGALRVTAVAAIHDGRRAPLGPRAASIGFLVEGSRTAYFAGDTDLFPGMASLAPSPALALLPVWGWGPTVGPGHLDPARAAAAAALISPEVAVPIHWGTLALLRPLRRAADGDRPAREFAALTARYAPDVEVRVLAPGGSTRIEEPTTRTG